MDSDQPEAGPSQRQIEGEEVEAEWLKLVKTNHDVCVKVGDKISLDRLPQQCSLMVVSNSWGLLIVGSTKDVRIFRLSEFQKTLESTSKEVIRTATSLQTIPLPSQPIWIRLAQGEEKLVIAISDNSLLIFSLADIPRGITQPIQSHRASLSSPLMDVIPNPAASSEVQSKYVALVSKEGMILGDLVEGNLSSNLSGPFTCGSWSAKGKQIVLGKSDGTLNQYSPDGTLKNTVAPPPELESPDSYPSFVQWIENDLFLACYTSPSATPEDPLEVFVIQRSKSEIVYTKFFDPLDSMGVSTRSSAYRYFTTLRSWGDRTRHLSFLFSGIATEVGVLHGSTEAGEAGPKWEALMLGETARGVMPAAKKGVYDDMSCLGLDLDLTSNKAIKQPMEGGMEQPDLPPAPRLLVYSQEGMIISFDVVVSDAGPYPGMTEVTDILSQQSSTPQMTAPASTTNPPPFSGPSQPSTTPISKPTTSAFGQTGFGQSSFGQPSTPSASKGFAGFGQSTTPTATPAKTAGFGGFGQLSQSTTFGQSSFGKPAFGQSQTPSSSGSAFSSAAPASSSSLGFGAFGSAQPSTSGTGFGFGSAGFGQSSKPATTGGSAFGSTSAFGQSSFGSAFGQKSDTSTSSGGFAGFGKQPVSTYTPSVSGTAAPSSLGPDKKEDDFGLGGFSSALESSIVPGIADSPPSSPKLGGRKPSGLDDDSPPTSPPPAPKAFGQTSSASSFIKPATGFSGSTSSFGGFGQSSKPSAFGQPSTPQSSAPKAFSTPPQSTSTTPSSAPAFGQSSTIAKPTFGNTFGSAFGQSSKPAAFGQSSSPGGGGFGNISGGFGAFAAKSAGATATSTSTGGASGFGAFASKVGGSPATSAGTGFAGFGGFGAKTGGPSAFETPSNETPEKKAEPVTTGEVKKEVQPEEAVLPAGYEVSSTSDTKETVKPEKAVLPAGYEDSAPVTSEEVAKPEKAVTPAGYEVPLFPPVTEDVKLEAAVLPAGYDVPVPGDEIKEKEDASETAQAVALPDVEDPDDAVATEEQESVDVKNVAIADDAGQEVDEEEDAEWDEEESYEEDEEEYDEEATEEGLVEEAEEDEEYEEEEEQYEDEEEDGGDDDQVEESPSPEKQDDRQKPPSMSSAGSSLLARMSPPSLDSSKSAPPAFNFNHKHASRTASPLGSQPPQINNESTTPVTSPAKPATPGFSLFGEPKPETKPSIASGFSAFGSKPPNAGQTTTSLFDPPKTSAGEASTGQVKSTSPFSLPANAQPDKQPAGKPAFDFGLGKPPSLPQPRPSTTPATNSKPAFSFGLGQPSQPAPPASIAPAQSPFSVSIPQSVSAAAGKALPVIVPQQPAVPVRSATQPPPPTKPEAPKPPPLSKDFSSPQRPKVPPAASRKQAGQPTLSSVLEGMVIDLQANMQQLSGLLQANAKYHQAIIMSNFAPLEHASDLDKYQDLPLSSIKDVSRIAGSLHKQLGEIRGEEEGSEWRLSDIQSLMVKTDMKITQIEQLKKAKNDPTHAAALHSNQLDSQQLSSQIRLRKAIQSIEMGLEELDARLSDLEDLNSGDIDQRERTIENLRKSINRVDSELQQRNQTVDDLSKRLSSMRVASPSPFTPPRNAVFSKNQSSPAFSSSGLTSSIQRNIKAFDVPEEVQASVKAAHDAQSRLSADWIKSLKGVKTRITKPLQSGKQEGPIVIEDQPIPGESKKTEMIETKAESDQNPDSSAGLPQPTPPSPTSAFSGIKFSLDPGQITSQHRSHHVQSSSRAKSHTSAAKLDSLGTSPPTVSTSGFSFALPNSTTGKTGSEVKGGNQPSGFVGFSGFGAK